jgi:dipeptidyl aminopeptidase/acylaminoacyl peptidase
MKQGVTFKSDGLTNSGDLYLPDNAPKGRKLPVFMVLHGFGSNKTSDNVKGPAAMLNEWGYAVLGFDMRGCGESEGTRANLICMEQVADTRSAVTFLQGRTEIDGKRIGVLGSSFGGAVAVYAAGVDDRIGACVSSGGWGNGEIKFKGQHPTPEAWSKFTRMLSEGKAYRERTGKSMMVDRYDIVPIPPNLRHNLASKSHEQFTAETAQSMFDFTADNVVSKIAPRPLLLLHSSVDSVTPTEQSIRMFELAGQPKDLHLFNETNHFMFAGTSNRVRGVLKEWLDVYFPAGAG